MSQVLEHFINIFTQSPFYKVQEGNYKNYKDTMYQKELTSLKFRTKPIRDSYSILNKIHSTILQCKLQCDAISVF